MSTNSEFILHFVQQYWPDIPINDHIINHPSSEFVIQIYQRFQETMNDILSTMAVTEAASEPEPTGDPIFSILCFVNKYLRRTFFNQSDVDCMSLTLSDLYEPTAKRTKVRIKVLLNVMLFYEERLNAVRETIVKRMDKVQAYENLKKEKEILKEKLAAEAESLASREDKLHKIEKEEEKVNLRYKNLQKQKGEKDREHTKLKQDLQDLVNTYQNKHALLTNLKTNIQSLNEQVVTEESYQTLLELKQNLAQKCTELETEIECLGTNLANRRPEVERFDNINKDLNTLKSVCEELYELQSSVSSISTQLQISSENYTQKNKELQSHKDNIIRYTQSTEAIKEALQSATAKNAALKEKMAEQIEHSKAKIDEEQKIASEIISRKDTLQEEIESTQNQIEEIRLQIEQLNISYADTYKNMLRSENSSTNNFNAVLENVREALAQDANQKST